MTDIYAEFGVTNAVLSEPSVGYNEEMMGKAISVRDGDDAINTNGTNAELSHAPEVEEEASSEETKESEQSEEQGETESEETSEESGDEPSDTPAFEAVEDAPEELTNAASRVAEGETALNDMVADAVSRGLPQETFEGIAAEYTEKGSISPEGYAELAKVGYTKAFIDSFIAGQEAVQQNYVNQIVDYAGGQDSFNALYAHLNATNKESAQALSDAIERRDMASIKGIINLAAGSSRKTFGKPAARTLSTQATPAKPQAPSKGGFESKAEMVKAMSDKRYNRDPQYTREVELKVLNAKF